VSHYDFQTLSPLDFEELVRDLLQAEFGLLFESFGPGSDLGIDFRSAIAGFDHSGRGRPISRYSLLVGRKNVSCISVVNVV
jgi:hypothetical protein